MTPTPPPPAAFDLVGATLVRAGGRRQRADVRIAGGVIQRCWPRGGTRPHRPPLESDPPSKGGTAPVLDLAGHLVFPGLVNAHDHLHLNVFGALRPRPPYAHADDWIADMAHAIEAPAARAWRAVPAAARAWHGALKNALAGATTVVHHDPWLGVFDAADFPITVVPHIGWAHSIGLAGAYGPTLAESLAAAPRGRPWFIHLGEGTDGRAAAELTALAAAGGLGPATRLVHAVGLTARDAAAAVAAGAGLIWCPTSNANLLGAVADPRPFAAARRAALGTDARLTGGRDLLDEMAFAAGGGLVAPDAMLDLVTAAGAALAGRPAAGRLTRGAPADLVVVRDDGRPPARQLVGARRGDLRLVIARGRPVVADLDLAEIFVVTRSAARTCRLDGRPKAVLAAAIAPIEAAGIVEPGLVIDPSVYPDIGSNGSLAIGHAIGAAPDAAVAAWAP